MEPCFIHSISSLRPKVNHSIFLIARRNPMYENAEVCGVGVAYWLGYDLFTVASE